MSKMSELSMMLDEMIQYGQGILSCMEEMKKCGEGMIKVATNLKEIFSAEEPVKAKQIAKSEQTAIPAAKEVPNVDIPEAKTYSFTDVRGALAAKSKEGYKEEVRSLIAKYGAEKLSDVDPKDYAALMTDVGGLTHE